jgi:hypothetical protein
MMARASKRSDSGPANRNESQPLRSGPRFMRKGPRIAAPTRSASAALWDAQLGCDSVVRNRSGSERIAGGTFGLRFGAAPSPIGGTPRIGASPRGHRRRGG